jgi:hypothetical protein
MKNNTDQDLDLKIENLKASWKTLSKNISSELNLSLNSFFIMLGIMIAPEIYKYFNIYNRFSIALITNKFPPIVGIPKDKIRYLLKFEKNSSDFIFETNQFLQTYYDEKKICEIHNKWKENDFLRSRTDMLDEIIRCHNSKLFFSSTILCVSQVEGIIAEGFCHSGKMNQSKYILYFQKLNGDSKNKQDSVFRNFMLDTLLVNFEHGGTLMSEISRHAIMHGADKNYGTFVNSIKSLLFLDYLADCFGYYHNDKSKVYHKFGCHYINYSSNKLQLIKKSNGSSLKNMSPCKKCINNK